MKRKNNHSAHKPATRKVSRPKIPAAIRRRAIARRKALRPLRGHTETVRAHLPAVVPHESEWLHARLKEAGTVKDQSLPFPIDERDFLRASQIAGHFVGAQDEQGPIVGALRFPSTALPILP